MKGIRDKGEENFKDLFFKLDISEIEKLEKLKEEIKERLILESSGHDWYHTFRVFKNSLKIAAMENEEVDELILAAAALLHDIADHKFGYSDEDRDRIIEELLKKYGFDSKFIADVCRIVNNISFSKGNIPEKKEGKIIQDADRLDALGAIGIARTFAYGGHKGRAMYMPEEGDGSDSIYHFYEKLLLLKDKMNTESGKKLAEERDRFMRHFLEEFYREWNAD